MSHFKRKCFLFGMIGCLLWLTFFIAFADDASNPSSQLAPSQPGSQEILESRTEHSKIFKNVDGTTSIYGSVLPMHYKDENGKWQEIDTTLEDGTGEKDEDGAAYGYHSKKNSFQIFLPAFSSGWTSLRSGNSQLSFKLMDSRNKRFSKRVLGKKNNRLQADEDINGCEINYTV